MSKVWGKHLIVDVYGVQSEKLTNKKYLARLLENLPKKLKMRILRKPVIDEIKSEMYPTTGLSGFVILYESHISFHTWPENNFIALDIYSCKEFDGKEAVEYLKTYFGPTRMKVKSIIRG